MNITLEWELLIHAGSRILRRSAFRASLNIGSLLQRYVDRDALPMGLRSVWVRPA